MKPICLKSRSSSAACTALVVFLAAWTAANAQNPDVSNGAGKGTVKDGYSVQQSWDLGGHIVSQRGSGAMYDTLVNMRPRPRILDAVLTARATAKAKHPWFDDLFTENSGYGGDPENVTVLRASKGKLYEFSGMFRRDRQYFDYNLLDNPLVPAGVTSNGYTFPQVENSPHLFNTVRRMTDADLTLRPLSKVSFHAGYSQNVMEGPTFSSYHLGAEAQLLQNWRNSTDEWRGAVDWKVFPKTTMTFEEVIVHYKGDTSWQLTGLNLQLSNGTPVTLGFDNTSAPSCGNRLAPIVSSTTSPPTANATCNGYLQYTRSAPTRILYPTEEFRFQSSDIKNVQMNGNLRYTSATTNLPFYNESFSGLETRSGIRAFTVTGNGNARRLNVNADYGMVWQFKPRLSLAEQVDYEDFRIPSADNYLETDHAGTSMLVPPAATGTTTATMDAIFLGEKTVRNALILRWQAMPRASFSLGYRYARDRIFRRDASGVDDFPIHRNGGYLSADLRPTHEWRLWGNAEIAYADNTYLQIKPRHLQHYQLRTTYRYKSWATVSGSFDDLERRNNVLYVDHLDHMRSGTLSAEVIPNGHFNMDVSYGYLDFFTRTDGCYLRGQKVKMWYGKYTVYLRNEEGKEVGKRRNIPLCPKAGTPKWKAEQMLHAIILNETGVPAKTTPGIPDDSATFRWFVEERYIPMRQGGWSPAYRKINTYEIKHYLVDHFGRVPLGQLGTFEIQVWLNNLATKYSQSVVRHCYSNIRSITHMAKKMNFLTSDPAEDVTMPQTKPVEKPQMTQKQILALIGGIQDLHDLCLMYVGIFCGPRASEVMGLQWKSWTGTTLVPHGTAFEGQFYPGRFKTRSSRAPIGVPEQVRPIIEEWKKACENPSPEALMFPTFGRGERTGQAVPRWGKNFLRWRVRPIAHKLKIPDHLVTFQVMRRTLGTDLQEHGTLKDAQGALRHASIRTTGDVYMQTIESSVLCAMNSRTMQVLAGREKTVTTESKRPVRNALVPKARRLASGGVQQLDQVGPSFERRVM